MSLYWIVAAILLPILGGALTPVLPFRSRKGMLLYLEALTLAASAIVLSLLAHGTTGTLHLVYFVRGLSISFRIDGLAMLFAGLVSILWPFAMLYAFEYMEKVQKMAAKDKRILMTDFVQGRVLEELYSNAYLFVLPSDIEGMAISLLEAMSYGNCCLVSDIKENIEVVEEKAVTFQKGSVEDLKKKLKELLKDSETVDKYKRESSSFICSKYNWDDVLEQTLALYRGKR